MAEITQKSLDKLCDDFEEITYRAGAWWHSVKDIKTKLEPRIKEKMAFAIWIVETANSPQTDEEKESRKYLMQLICDNLNDETGEG